MKRTGQQETATRAVAEGNYDAAAIYDPTPYQTGMSSNNVGAKSYPYADKTFDYEKLYEPGEKRKPAGDKSTMELAEEANSEDWMYTVPGSQGKMPGYYAIGTYDYYLIRGFAVIEAGGIGTYGLEGYELCGSDLERDSHKCIVEWLHGDRTAYTDKENNITISAHWCNGNVAMTGGSYGGTLPFEVATTGVEGLKTIIPVAGISSWYDYANSQGVSTYSEPHYTDIWKKKDYILNTEKINCSALIVHGLNDFNIDWQEIPHPLQLQRRDQGRSQTE